MVEGYEEDLRLAYKMSEIGKKALLSACLVDVVGVKKR